MGNAEYMGRLLQLLHRWEDILECCTLPCPSLPSGLPQQLPATATAGTTATASRSAPRSTTLPLTPPATPSTTPATDTEPITATPLDLSATPTPRGSASRGQSRTLARSPGRSATQFPGRSVCLLR